MSRPLNMTFFNWCTIFFLGHNSTPFQSFCKKSRFSALTHTTILMAYYLITINTKPVLVGHLTILILIWSII